MATVEVEWVVDIIESEAGWGQKVDETKVFDTEEEANTFVTTHNAQNNLPYTPSIYWRAEAPRMRIKKG